jgi:Sec-independent protein translocase protein TatA
MEKTKKLTKLTIVLVVAALIFGGLAASLKGTVV